MDASALMASARHLAGQALSALFFNRPTTELNKRSFGSYVILGRAANTAGASERLPQPFPLAHRSISAPVRVALASVWAIPAMAGVIVIGATAE
jgi:hypothetical protein